MFLRLKKKLNLTTNQKCCNTCRNKKYSKRNLCFKGRGQTQTNQERVSRLLFFKEHVNRIDKKQNYGKRLYTAYREEIDGDEI